MSNLESIISEIAYIENQKKYITKINSDGRYNHMIRTYDRNLANLHNQKRYIEENSAFYTHFCNMSDILDAYNESLTSYSF